MELNIVGNWKYNCLLCKKQIKQEWCVDVVSLWQGHRGYMHIGCFVVYKDFNGEQQKAVREKLKEDILDVILKTDKRIGT